MNLSKAIEILDLGVFEYLPDGINITDAWRVVKAEIEEMRDTITIFEENADRG